MALAKELRRLGTQSAIYGLGGLLSRLIAIFLLPLYTSYLGPVGFGKLETIFAFMAVLTILLRLGITSAFFRFYFDTDDDEHRLRVVRTSFWFTMGMATLGLVVGVALADPISRSPPRRRRRRRSSAPGFVWLWTQMNYAQITALFRVEQRPVAFAIATRRERADHDRRDGRARRRRRQGRDRRGRREPARDARRLRRAARLPALPARPHVRPAAAARDEPLRAAARAGGADALGRSTSSTACSSRTSTGRPRSASTRWPSGSRR